MSKIDKFNGTQIRFAVGYEPQFTTPERIETNAIAISPTFHVTSHGLKDADVIYLTGLGYIAGSGYFPVKVKDENSFIVVGADFSFATDNDLTQVQFAKAKLSGMCNAKNIKITPYTISTEDITTNCDLVKQEAGSVEAGSMSMDLHWQIDNALHQALENMGATQTPTYYQFRKHGGAIIRGFKGLVNSFEYSGEVNSNYSGSIGLKHQSLMHDVKIA